MSELKVTPQMVVSFTYSILSAEGEILEQSDLPMSYLHGVDGKMFPKVEQALTGKRIGEEVRVSLSSAESFGPRDEELTFQDQIDNVPPEYRHIGAEAMFENSEGESVTMTVTKIDDGMITLDGNHPFAGKDLTFHVKVTDMRPASMEEVGKGEVLESQNPVMH